jgi:signal transduction histidine kinase
MEIPSSHHDQAPTSDGSCGNDGCPNPAFEDQASQLAELGSLASLLAHEINNQMTLAQAHTQLALRDQNAPRRPDAAYHTLEQLLPIIKRTALLTESMMQYAQPSETCEQEEIEPCDIHEAHEVAASFAAPPDDSSDPIGFSISCNTGGNTPQINATALEQVLINLYMNAARSINERRAEDPEAHGSILVNATLECSTWNTPHIRITVQDSGLGIESSDLPSIFQPWNRGKSGYRGNSGAGTNPISTGHGLGLAVCEKLITSAGGSIHCESTQGIGTTFTILLPAVAADNLASDQDAQAA